ncbi:MAG: DUF4159 domain-containing protein [Chloroflexi bacterium]|nr:DUF4159 domain-containing protein [Chloroflexota bacterium]
MKSNFDLYPRKRILPYDGMSITAGVWDEAHRYHVQLHNAHQYFVHGTGIVSGLEVVASDPPDSIVYVLPGVALDDSGKMIVLSEPVAYDLGKKIDGKLYLLLLHREVKAPAPEGQESNAPTYMQDEFVIVARPDQVDAPHVELARLNRLPVDAPVTDAADPAAPGANALDLRFRRYVCPPQPEQVLAGVSYLGDVPEQNYHLGLNRLVRPLAAVSPFQLIVENHTPLDQGLFDYGLVYLVATRAARLDKGQAEILRSYVENGGKVLLEFCERVENEGTPAELLGPAGISLRPAGAAHAVFQSPHLFYAPPQGGVAQERATVWYDEAGVLATNGVYGSLWSGGMQHLAVSRGVIRDAIEWGVNLLNYLLSQV